MKKPVRHEGPDTPSRIERELAHLSAGTDAAHLIDGTAALAAEQVEVDSRTSADRAEADRRSAERIARRQAGRADAEERRRLRVAPPAPVAMARAPFIAMLITLVVVGVVGILVLTAKINANQFRLDHLQSQQTGLDAQEQQIQQTLNQQSSPTNLAAIAACLGLVPAGKLAYLQMPDGTIVGVAAPATNTPSSCTGAGAIAPSTAPSAGSLPSASTPAASTTGTNATGTNATGTNATGANATGTNAAGANPAGAGNTGAGTTAAGNTGAAGTGNPTAPPSGGASAPGGAATGGGR